MSDSQQPLGLQPTRLLRPWDFPGKSAGVVCHCLLRIYALLLLSRFNCVRLCATPEMAAHQAPPSLGFSRQEHWGCHCLLQCMKVKSKSEVDQSCPTPSDPMDCNPPGSSVHGICQARVLEWVAIAFSIYVLVYCIGVFLSGLLHSV